VVTVTDVIIEQLHDMKRQKFEGTLQFAEKEKMQELLTVQEQEKWRLLKELRDKVNAQHREVEFELLTVDEFEQNLVKKKRGKVEDLEHKIEMCQL
jgi:hypothetical protein